MQRMVRMLALICLITGSTAALPAASLSLTSNNISWNPASSSVSPKILVGLLNSQTVNDADLLTGWQLNLKLQPQGSATGTVRFNSATIPGGGYVLESNSAGLGANVDAAGTTLTAFDDDDSLPLGVAVPATGKSLLSLDFSTLNNASGTFQLLALAPPGGFTQWGDAIPADRYFTNVPLAAPAPIVLATITVVPEPSTLALCGIGGVFLAGQLWQRRKTRRCVPAAA
jgi:hypothetical protein